MLRKRSFATLPIKDLLLSIKLSSAAVGRNYILTGQYTEIYFPSKGIRYIAVNDNVDTLNGESELAPFLNILNEMHARQTSKKVKAAMRSGLIRRRAGSCHLFSIQYRWVRVPSCGS